VSDTFRSAMFMQSDVDNCIEEAAPRDPRGWPVRHSPGPFSVGASRACEIEILDAKGCEVARVDIPITADRSIDPCDVQAANVKLLTASPDLLKACKYALARFTHGPDAITNPNDAIVDDLRAAIAKAGGAA